MTEVLVRVRFPEPGGDDLAQHIHARLDSAVVSVLVDDLSDSERQGVTVSTEIVEGT